MKNIDLNKIAKALSGYGVTASVVVVADADENINNAYVQLWLSLLGTAKSLTWTAQLSHWNLSGLDFLQIHEWLGKQYQFLFDAQDTVAEHIKTLDIDFVIPFDTERHSRLAELAHNAGSSVDIHNLLTVYRDDLRVLKAQIAELNKAAGDENDAGGADFLGSFAGEVDKSLWFVKSLLKEQAVTIQAQNSR